MFVVPTVWQPSTAFAAGLYVTPTAANATAFYYRALTPTGPTGPTEPAWPIVLGQTVVDGGVTWACAIIAPIITQQDLEDRLSRRVVQQILDDNNDGFTDAAPIGRLLADSTSYVFGLIGGQFDFPIGSPYPNELQRIALDVAVGYASMRHPEIVRFDGAAALALARAELKDLKTGISQLDIPPMGVSHTGQPIPPAPVAPKARNVGGIIYDSGARMFIDDADGTVNSGDF